MKRQARTIDKSPWLMVAEGDVERREGHILDGIRQKDVVRTISAVSVVGHSLISLPLPLTVIRHEVHLIWIFDISMVDRSRTGRDTCRGRKPEQIAYLFTQEVRQGSSHSRQVSCAPLPSPPSDIIILLCSGCSDIPSINPPIPRRLLIQNINRLGRPLAKDHVYNSKTW